MKRAIFLPLFFAFVLFLMGPAMGEGTDATLAADSTAVGTIQSACGFAGSAESG